MNGMMTPNPGPIADVREGMVVIDADQHTRGKVIEVKLGDPGAVTEHGQDDLIRRPPSLPGRIAAVFGLGGRELPDQEHARLLRLGYVRVRRPGPFGGKQYVPADLIRGVEGDVVRLRGTSSA